MKVLISGGAGFIGSNLVDKLLERGDEVCCIDNLATAPRTNLPASHPKLTFIEGTIADAALVNRAFDEFKPDKVLHAAASYKDPNAWEEDIETNVLGTINMVRAAERHAVKRFVYFQTALCYGLKPKESPITLNHPINPEGSSYAFSKTGGEQYIVLSNLPYVTFRLANVYGPRNISGPLPTFYQRLASGKKCFVTDSRRDFLYIDHLVAVVMKCITEDIGTGAYHISSGADVSIKELFEATVSAMGIKLDEPVEVKPRSEDDSASILLDPSRTYKDFGIKPEMSLQEGVRRTVEWYRANEVKETYTHLKVAKG